MKKVSIIVPVYNVEKYLEECIESMLNQTYTNIEIILVDDGSTDSSGKICDKYKIIDNRVKVIHKKNEGVSSARNTALDMIDGEYLCFVDSDDYVDKDFILKLVENLNDNDMTICGYIEKYLDKEEKIDITNQIQILTNVDIMNQVIGLSNIKGYLWNKLFKTEIIKNNKISFSNNICLCEDMYFVIQYLKYCNCVAIIPENLYYYRMRASSAVWSKNIEKKISIFVAYEEIYSILKEIEAEQLDSFMYSYVADFFSYKKYINNDKYKKLSKIDINKEFWSLIHSKKINFKKKIKLMSCRYFKIAFKMYMKLKILRYKLYE